MKITLGAFSKKVTLVTTAFVLAVSSFAAAIPFLVNQKVYAASETTVVTPVSMQGWEKYGDATMNFVSDPTAFLGTSSLNMSATGGSEYGMLWKDATTSIKASDLNVHYTTKRLAGPIHAAPSYVLLIDRDGDDATVDSFYALYEPAYNKTGSENFDNWNTWQITPASKFWYAGAYGTKPTEVAAYTPLSDLLTYYPNATVQATVLNIGTGNAGWSTLADNVKTADGTVYDFERASIAPCTTTSNLHSASLTAWDMTQTRATGHNTVTTDGLHVWTEGATSTDKAAGYYATDFALAEVGVPNIEFVNFTGGRPSLQLGVDKDANGTWDGYLVYEPWAYGDGKFWSNGSFGITSGMGYNSFGTLNDYLNANPNARVTSIGYSLGSDVLGDATISKLTAGCVDYTFGILAPTLTVTTPAEGASVSTKLNGDKLRIEGVFKDDIKANYATMQLVRNGSSVAIGTLYGYGSVYNPAATYADADGNYIFDLPVPADLPDGEYSLFYIGTDFEGGITARMERKFFIDNTAPNVPNNLRLQVRSTGNFVGQNGWTNRSDVTALWNSNNTEAVTYEYQYWNDVATSPYNSGNRWTTSSATEMYAGTVNQGEGKHYFCVVAIDLAGNRSNCSAPFGFNYDATNPVTNIVVSPVVDGKFTVSGDASDNLSLNRVYVQLVSRVTGLRCGGTTIHLIGQGTNASWSANYDLATLGANCPEGNFAAHVEAADMAGNRGTAGWTENFFVEAPSDNTGDGEDGDGETDPEQGGQEGGDATQNPDTTPTSTPVPAAVVVAPQDTTPDAEIDTADDADSNVSAAGDSDSSNEVSTLSDQDNQKSWSLVNALLTAGIVLGSIMALVGAFGKKQDKDAKSNRVVGLITLIPAIGAAILFFAVEDLSAKMVWLNTWTILVTIIAVLQVALVAKARDNE